MNEGKRTDRQLSTQRSTQRLPRAGARHCSPTDPEISAQAGEIGRSVPEPHAVGVAEPSDAATRTCGARAPGRGGTAGSGRSHAVGWTVGTAVQEGVSRYVGWDATGSCE